VSQTTTERFLGAAEHLQAASTLLLAALPKLADTKTADDLFAANQYLVGLSAFLVRYAVEP
jgi:hypothetical protein